MKALAFVTICFLSFAGAAYAATNISATASDHWAWSDAMGWIDLYSTGNVALSSQKLTGYASSSVGDVSFDCATTRNGNICATASYGVTNDGAGNLSGWAWNDAVGWISFDCNNTGSCGTANYRVLVDGATGAFTNYAWSEIGGWISFNCANHGGCATSNYKTVATWQATSTAGWVESSIFDTTSSGTGAKVNAVLWRGSEPAGTAVSFRFATATSSGGPWTYVGPDGTAGTSYGASVDTWVTLAYDRHGGRYIRYRVDLHSNQAQTLSPRIDEIVVNWSP